MPEINDAERAILRNCLSELQSVVISVRNDVATAVGGFEIPTILTLEQEIQGCRQALEGKPPNLASVDEKWAPILKRALILKRRSEATSRDGRRERAHHPELMAKFDALIEPLDYLLEKDWLVDADPITVPHLTDFLNIEAVQSIQQSKQLANRIYDEKFHVLQSPRLFPDDLDHYREMCDMRGIPLVVAFLDIDDFKTFNTRHGEIVVDRQLLSPLMRLMEAHVFNRGFAYRFAGDEYVFLLPNYAEDEAVTLVKRFQERLATIVFQDIDQNPTMSIGLCGIDRDCGLTNVEVLQAAARGKDFAKAQGKNRIATVSGPSFDDTDTSTC